MRRAQYSCGMIRLVPAPAVKLPEMFSRQPWLGLGAAARIGVDLADDRAAVVGEIAHQRVHHDVDHNTVVGKVPILHQICNTVGRAIASVHQVADDRALCIGTGVLLRCRIRGDAAIIIAVFSGCRCRSRHLHSR